MRTRWDEVQAYSITNALTQWPAPHRVCAAVHTPSIQSKSTLLSVSELGNIYLIQTKHTLNKYYVVLNFNYYRLVFLSSIRTPYVCLVDTATHSTTIRQFTRRFGMFWLCLSRDCVWIDHSIAIKYLLTLTTILPFFQAFRWKKKNFFFLDFFMTVSVSLLLWYACRCFRVYFLMAIIHKVIVRLCYMHCAYIFLSHLFPKQFNWIHRKLKYSSILVMKNKTHDCSMPWSCIVLLINRRIKLTGTTKMIFISPIFVCVVLPVLQPILTICCAQYDVKEMTNLCNLNGYFTFKGIFAFSARIHSAVR